MQRHMFRVVPAVCLVLAAAASVSGCGEEGGRFNAQAGGGSPDCLVHQSESPGEEYTPGGEDSEVTALLQVMRYYTANGGKDYCDGKPATDVDVQWMDLYVASGGAAKHVPHRG